MKIRLANSKDIDSVAELFDAYRVFYKKESDLEGARTFISSRIEIGDSKIYVAQDDSTRILGFMQLYPLFSSTKMKRLWLLNDLFVHPENRSQGIGKKLIAQAKELARETNSCGLYLETGKTNDTGNHLYPSVGMSLNKESNFYEWFL